MIGGGGNAVEYFRAKREAVIYDGMCGGFLVRLTVN